MKTAYFDCFAGAAGDMILGALLDAGLPLEEIKGEIAKLGLDNYSIGAGRVVKGGIAGTRALIHIDQEHHGHHHRHFSDIREIIGSSGLDEDLKTQSISIFKRLAEAEARVHDMDIEEVHFHEVGAMDAIIDVVGAVAGLDLLGVDKVTCSPLHLGSGTVTCAHGVLPVPAPATAFLVKGKPVYSTGVKGELLTPTGAAILTTLGSDFGPMPEMTIDRIGYGAGTSELEIPNLLRVTIGTSAYEAIGLSSDQVVIIETNVDDMTPQIYDYLIEKTLGIGALDIFFTPAQMKKNRPGTLITVICNPQDVKRFAELLINETTSIGLRWRFEKRLKADREIKEVETPYGKIRAKFASIGDKFVNVSPEYEDCKEAARKQGVPLKKVMEAVKKLAE